MKLTPIPDKEAAQLIGASYATIRNAVKRGDLIRYPQPGLVQHVIKEQVLLFRDKTQVKRGLLNREEFRSWGEIEDQIIGKVSPGDEEQTIPNTSTVAVNMDPEGFVRALVNQGVINPNNQLTFHSALAEKPDSEEDPRLEFDFNEWGTRAMICLVILLGLVWLLTRSGEVRQQAIDHTVQTLERIGLEKEDPIINQGKTYSALKKHPKEAEKLKDILDREGYQDPRAA